MNRLIAVLIFFVSSTNSISYAADSGSGPAFPPIQPKHALEACRDLLHAAQMNLEAEVVQVVALSDALEAARSELAHVKSNQAGQDSSKARGQSP
ncbi:MAG: hypothetical protein J0I21_06450 [Alphaproteobacteria bacterium]|nr:hypothetical protein [Alphaproteobacteria bacterium]